MKKPARPEPVDHAQLLLQPGVRGGAVRAAGRVALVDQRPAQLGQLADRLPGPPRPGSGSRGRPSGRSAAARPARPPRPPPAGGPRSAPPSPPGEASTCAVLPRRSGSDASSVVWLRSATNASCSGARARACAWTSPVATAATPSRSASSASRRLRARSSRWNGRCSSTRRPSRPKAASSRRSVGSSCTPWRAQPLRQTRPGGVRLERLQRHGRRRLVRDRACGRARA